MITETYRDCYWKTNANDLLGYPPGTLVCVGYWSGGPFIGGAERLTMAPPSVVAKGGPAPRPWVFPTPGADVCYKVGGPGYRTVNYYNLAMAERESP